MPRAVRSHLGAVPRDCENRPVPEFERSVALLNVATLVAALERLPCPECGVVFAVRPGSREWELATPEQRQCSSCGEARGALNAVGGTVGWPSPFDGIYHEERARRVLAALGPEWASAYRYAAWVEEVELRAERAGGGACRAAGAFLQAIDERIAEPR
jgi:hypothetical protein